LFLAFLILLLPTAVLQHFITFIFIGGNYSLFSHQNCNRQWLEIAFGCLGDGGAVLVNGNTYLSSNGSLGGGGGYANQNGISGGGYTNQNGISNGYINPDVIPMQSQQQQPMRPPSFEETMDKGGFLGRRS
jgi:hypothetical protein